MNIKGDIMAIDINPTSNFLYKTQSVLSASKMLRQNLDASQAKLEIVTTQLETAARQQESDGAGYRTFMFSELEATSEANKTKRESLAEDSLISILADLDVANVLMAAGQAKQEIGKEAQPSLLDEANRRLDNTISAIDRSQANASAEQISGRFGFADEPSRPERIVSEDLQSAIDGFKSRSDGALSMLIAESKGAVKSSIDAMQNLDRNSISSILDDLGSQMRSLPKVGRLYSIGISKLEGAINALIRMLGSEALAKTKDKVAEILNAAREGNLVDRLLEMAFGIQTTKALIDEKMRSRNLNKDELDKASEELAQLKVKFKEKMEMMKRITSAVVLGGILLTPFVGPNAVLAAASAHVIILAGVVLIGMDYTDSGCILNQVRGVGEIAKGLGGM
jgi:hypothetical protein